MRARVSQAWREPTFRPASAVPARCDFTIPKLHFTSPVRGAPLLRLFSTSTHIHARAIPGAPAGTRRRVPASRGTTLIIEGSGG